MAPFDSLYAALPVFAQNWAVSLFGLYWRWLRFGPGFDGMVQAYRSREGWDRQQWQALQQQRLKAVLSAAAEHIPYYRNVWSAEQKLAAREGQIERLPLLEKDAVRTSPEDFCRSDVPHRGVKTFHTSGSSGTPIASSFTIPELRATMAVREARSAGWAGVSFREARATFSGRMVVPDPHSKGPFHRFNRAENQVYISPFHLRPENATAYLEALERHQVRWMTGYAVSYYLLARFIEEQGLRPPQTLRAIITTSEKLTPEMRHLLEKVFRCNVYEEYSTVENVLFASQCEHGRLHVSPDIGTVEILRPDGNPCASGEPGEVVATSLIRGYQPLIRYRLGDVAAWDDQACPCGRQMPVIGDVVGRVEDVVFSPDGRQMVRFHGIFVDQPHIREGQIIQESLEHIRVRVVTSGAFGQEDIDEIIRRVHQRLGWNVRVSIEPVAAIERTKAGKFQAVISKVGRVEPSEK